MDISLGIVFGMVAMIGWGIADFLVVKAVRKSSIFKIFLWQQLIGAVILFFIFSSFFRFPFVSFTTIGIILVTCLLSVVGYVSFYKGLKTGKVSIISPIASCWAVVTVILSLFFLGERLTLLHGFGIVLAIAGTVLASLKAKGLAKMKGEKVSYGVKYAIIAMLAWGILFVLVGIVVDELRWILPMLLIKSITAFYLLAYLGATKGGISFPKNAALLVTLIGVLDVVAYLSYGIGVLSEYNAIVAPVAAAFPAVTILLARIFFKEELETGQKMGIISILIGLVLLSIQSI